MIKNLNLHIGAVCVDGEENYIVITATEQVVPQDGTPAYQIYEGNNGVAYSPIGAVLGHTSGDGNKAYTDLAYQFCDANKILIAGKLYVTHGGEHIVVTVFDNKTFVGSNRKFYLLDGRAEDGKHVNENDIVSEVADELTPEEAETFMSKFWDFVSSPKFYVSFLAAAGVGSALYVAYHKREALMKLLNKTAPEKVETVTDAVEIVQAVSSMSFTTILSRLLGV